MSAGKSHSFGDLFTATLKIYNSSLLVSAILVIDYRYLCSRV